MSGRGQQALTGKMATRKMIVRMPLGRVSEWLAATLEMWCPVRGCGFEPRALRLQKRIPNRPKTPFFTGFSAFFVRSRQRQQPVSPERGHKETQQDNFIYCGMHRIGHQHTCGVSGGTGP